MASKHTLCLVFAMCLSLTFGLESYMAEDGYEVFPTVPGSRYKLVTFTQTWAEAFSYCQADGGGSHLIVINSEAEATVVKTLFARITDPETLFLFVGTNDIAQEGNWVTVLGGLVSTSGYNKWLDGEPNNSQGGEDCGSVTRDALYNDQVCTYQDPYICEKPDV